MNTKKLKKLIESLSKIENDLTKTKEKISDLKMILRKEVLKNNLKLIKKL